MRRIDILAVLFLLIFAPLATRAQTLGDFIDLLPRGTYALNLGNQRPNSPYPAMQNYNTTLDQPGSGPGFPVQVSRHHIIPYTTLRDFYNAVLNNGHIFRPRRLY